MNKNGMVVCPQPEAAESGIEILRAGGNAVDAAVACALAQTVVDPLMCGIAGFGTGTVYSPRTGRHEYVDFHAPAPGAARPDMWEHLLEGEARDGFGFVLKGRVNDIGPQSIAVPGTLMGLKRMHERHGCLPWAEVVAPAIQWARDGYFVRPAMYTFWIDEPLAGRAGNLERLAYSEDGRKLYCRADGRPKTIGTPIQNPDYADTLELIARDGIDSFYRGDLARRMVDDIRAQGGILSLEDLANYAPTFTQPLMGTYRDRKITTNQPPGGGAMLIEMLNILENFDLRSLEHNGPAYIKTVCEAMKRATADKDTHIGDPAFVDVPLDRILAKEYAKACAERIRAGEKASVPRLNPGGAQPKDTTHLSVVDKDGNCVALTHSLAMPSGVITPGLGFLYNGCMGVFDPRPGRAGSIAPGKARFTSSCPTIVFKDGKPEIVLGAPGGTQIAMGVVQTILNVIDFDMPILDAVAAPRFSSTSDLIDVCNRIPRYVTRELEADGYGIARNPFGYTIGWVHAVHIDSQGRLDGAADPGRDGAALYA
ncbi:MULTISPECIES: gamma-glutamyltransferase [unclassified Achromobacter]|uniref:gamma-glutamyltransferase n=1 Tax=unclassified Achromobacter TaxID=2626865 RepID=UPI000B517CB5|nr:MULTISPECIES: gamma-glutamyltransferase [unclassified Achromobacter]OWT81080.1 gamma-glutamyltransferase [Achromobacter sp. HZ34]OWT82581.1 gamma-glutamyltransferase [Achromobacter sp. HZ28]